MSNKKLRIVDMCIYIDEHIYQKDYDKELIYKYLYLIIYSLAKKNNYFKNKQDYINYSHYCAQSVYLRLTSTKQFISENNKSYLKPVKSVLNYIKRIMYPLRVNYQRMTFNEVINTPYKSFLDNNTLYEQILDTLKTRNNPWENNLSYEIEIYLQNIHKNINTILDNTPYAKNKHMRHNLYMSCLISFLSSITLNNKVKQLLLTRNKGINDNKLTLLYEKENKVDNYVCWNLDSSFKPYIFILVNKLKKYIICDIRGLMQDYSIDSQLMEDVLLLSSNGKMEEENNE